MSELNGVTSTISTHSSPKVSTSGLGTDEHAPKRDRFTPFGGDLNAPGMDSLHWSGVQKAKAGDDARSLASSLAAERDDKSVNYDESVAHEEVELHDDFGPLPQALAGDGDGATLVSESSIAESFASHVHKQSSQADGKLVAGSPPSAVLTPRNLHAHEASSGAGAVTGLAPSDAGRSSSKHSLDSSRAAVDGDDAPPSPGALPSPTAPRSEAVAVPAAAGHRTTEGDDDEDEQAPDSGSLPHGSEFHPANAAAVVTRKAAPLPEDAGGGGAAPSAAHYSSRLMQRLTVEGGDDEEDDLVVHSAATVLAAPRGLAGPSSAGARSGAASPVPLSSGVEGFEIEQPAGPSVAAAAQQPAAPQQQQQEPPYGTGEEWDRMFKGLVYSDGRDGLGRPVIVVDADVVPPHMKSSALVYIKAQLEPLVSAGDYVLVLAAKKARLPSMWVMGAYHSLPRPFRKNVKWIILVRPSFFIRAVLAVMRPFVSHKAGRKIRQVQTLTQLVAATGGEVSLSSLGSKWAAHAAAEAEAAAPAGGA